MYRINTSKIVIEDRVLERGRVVTSEELAGLAAYFMSLGLIEAEQEESAQAADSPRSALARWLMTTMPPMADA